MSDEPQQGDPQEEAVPQTLKSMFEQRAKLVEARDDLKRKKEFAQKELDTFDESLDLEFLNEGVTSVKVEDLGTLTRIEKVRASILKERKEEGMAAFKQHYPDMVTEVINANTLSAFVSDMIKAGREMPKDIEECLNVYRQPGFRWTKSAKAKA